MILNTNVITIRCFLIKKGMGNEKYILLLNNVISILDLFKILTYYMQQENFRN